MVILLVMTLNAYIDDGVLDVCVVTAGDPLLNDANKINPATVRQIT